MPLLWNLKLLHWRPYLHWCSKNHMLNPVFIYHIHCSIYLDGLHILLFDKDVRKWQSYERVPSSYVPDRMLVAKQLFMLWNNWRPWNGGTVCPALSNILINAYRNNSQLFVDGQCILSKEGTTKGDPLAMAMYAIGTRPQTGQYCQATQLLIWAWKVVGFSSWDTCPSKVEADIQRHWYSDFGERYLGRALATSFVHQGKVECCAETQPHTAYVAFIHRQ